MLVFVMQFLFFLSEEMLVLFSKDLTECVHFRHQEPVILLRNIRNEGVGVLRLQYLQMHRVIQLKANFIILFR